ncbi:uncharacterized protein [Eurosta solidaginis]|uniref:uncharacterized protein isoform X2 n=1 Tax=Eurosta solidaginis TaxID=178769 RepID=UPI0035311193
MPNVVHRSKPNQLLKLEKENENKDLRRKLKSQHKERSPILNNKETVWDRLSKVKRSASNDTNFLTGTKSRTILPSKSSHKLQQPARITVQRAIKRPLTPNSNQNRLRVMEKRSTQRVKDKTPYIPSLAEADSMLNCKGVKSVKEILTARSICNSKTSSEDYFMKKISARLEDASPRTIEVPQLESYVTDEFEIASDMGSQESLDEYEIAPLIPVPTTDTLNMSANIALQFRRLLDCRKRDMAPDEISMIKKVVKTDERHRELQPNDSILFKEILKTQLKEIIRQETVVKSALHNLDELPDADCPSTVAIHKADITTDTPRKKPQVDVIFKNVPTLEKEIIILKALGEKLEATLKRTVSQGDLKLVELSNLATPIEYRWCSVCVESMQHAINEFVPKGVRKCIGVVQEFRIEYKTIVELKEQASHHFYLPSNKDNAELKRTSFKRLKENPDLLMRYLKPKNTLVPFNVLDQDPCFFNSFLYSPCLLDGMESTLSLTKDSAVTPECSKVAVKETDDSARIALVPYKYVKEPLKIEEIQCTLNDAIYNEISPQPNQALDLGSTEVEVTKKESLNLREAPVRGRKRRRIRRNNTPLPLDINPNPKFHLFKTVLVGSVQISVFLLLIMAITYPDIRC